MAATAEVEESPRFFAFLEYLEAHGALEPAGYCVLQPELAAALSLQVRTLRVWVQRAEHIGILRVARTTVTKEFGANRAPNTYHLRFPAARWRDELCGPYMEAKRARRYKAQSIRAKAASIDKARKERAKQRAARPQPVPVDEGAIAPLVEQYRNGDLADLAGW